MKKTITSLLLLAAITLLTTSCDRYDGESEEPSYLRIAAVTVVDNPSDSWSQEDGFFTSRIDAVNVTIWKSGDAAETQLGTFHLPCTIPVLREGTIDKVRILPAVKQNGIAGTRMYYPYYKEIELFDVELAKDSVTDLDTLHTRYISKSLMRVAWQEFFEPGPSTVSLDSVVERLTYKADTVAWGYGCGVVRVPDTLSSLSFWTSATFNIPDPTSYLYLEMDYWSDFDFLIGMYNPMQQNGSNQIVYCMTIYGRPERGWQKIYINLGKIWANNYYYYPDIRLYFTIKNSDGKSGNLFLDNMKLVVM